MWILETHIMFLLQIITIQIMWHLIKVALFLEIKNSAGRKYVII